MALEWWCGRAGGGSGGPTGGLAPALLAAVVLFLAASMATPGVHAQEEGARPLVRIAFVADDADPLAETLRDLVRRELIALARDDFDVRFPEDLALAADGTPERVAELLERMLAEAEVEVVVAQGLISSQVAAHGAPWPTPVIASTVFDARLQGFPDSMGTSGVANLAYVAPTPPGPVVRDLRRFQELATFSTAAILVDEGAAETFAGFLERLRDTAADLGIELETVPVGAMAASALDHLPASADAVYVTPLPRLSPGEFERLAEGLAERRLPSFSYSGDDVARGIMASQGAADLPLLARRIALNAYRILLGDDAAALPVTLAPSEELVVNMRTVRTLGVLPPLGALLGARRLFEAPEGVEREVTLRSSLEEAMAANLALTMEEQALLAGAEEIGLARASLLPQLDAGLTGAAAARSVAEASYGQRPQYNVDGNLTLRQLIYAQDARANLAVQRSYQASREWDRASLELDVALEAAEAYLNVLRAKTLEQVQQDNLGLTLASLRLAQVRERIGAAGPGERLRLESELARRRADRIEAFATRSTAEMSLNQVLNRPLDEPFTTPEAEVESRRLLDGTLATDYLGDLNRFSLVGGFLVDAALDFSPEIRSLDAVVAAQETLLASTRRAFYLPTVALQGSLSTNVLREGAGTTPPAGLTSAELPDYPWNAALSVALPLFQGRARVARREQATATLAQVRLQREIVGRRIEQNVRVQLEFARASLAVVGEHETAVETARQSLEMVTEAYAQGLASVVDLLEAQTSALLSERSMANAIFDYLINLKRVERAVGRFEILATPEQRVGFLRRLEAYVERPGGGS